MSYKLEMNPTSVIEVRLGLEDKGPVHQFLTNTCALHMDKYLPWDTGSLAETVVIDGNINDENVSEDEIVYAQDYAKYVYYGIRGDKELNYQTDVHELAGPYWDRNMVSAEIDDVCEEVQNYINRFGGYNG